MHYLSGEELFRALVACCWVCLSALRQIFEHFTPSHTFLCAQFLNKSQAIDDSQRDNFFSNVLNHGARPPGSPSGVGRPPAPLPRSTDYTFCFCSRVVVR